MQRRVVHSPVCLWTRVPVIDYFVYFLNAYSSNISNSVTHQGQCLDGSRLGIGPLYIQL